MKYFTPLLLLFVCFGCNDSQNKTQEDVVYFGGEIINPVDDYVVLYHKGEFVDSLKLDDNNRFMGKFKNHQDGLYKFYHYPEYQYIYLEKGDSLLLRLNTYKFDESLFFTGKGAEKNNFYIELFLLNSSHERPVYQYTKLNSEDFLKKIDSLQDIKLEMQKKFFAANPDVSEAFKTFTDKSIQYRNFRYRERYQNEFFERKKEDSTLTLVNEFYAYKAKVDTNDSLMCYYRPYTHYIMQYINNYSYSECLQKSWKGDKPLNTSLTYNKNKLKLIDSLVTYSYLRNELLRYTAYSYFRNNTTDIIQNNEFFKFYQKVATDSKSKEEITNLHNGIKSLQSGNSFSNQIFVYNEKHARIPVNSLNSRRGKTVYYFWTSSQNRHKHMITKKIKALSQQHPDLNVVGISLDEDHKRWKKDVQEFNFPNSKQYRVGKRESILRDFALISINKLIITDRKGNIVNAFANIFKPDFLAQLN
ncbi:MAG: thioredoxin-like domain-containing protein [Bacteroidota bacterium]